MRIVSLMNNTTNTATEYATVTVILPCGDVGTAPANPPPGGEVKVVHYDRANGRGPWIYQAEQLALADEETAAAYHARCEAFES